MHSCWRAGRPSHRRPACPLPWCHAGCIDSGRAPGVFKVLTSCRMHRATISRRLARPQPEVMPDASGNARPAPGLVHGPDAMADASGGGRSAPGRRGPLQRRQHPKFLLAHLACAPLAAHACSITRFQYRQYTDFMVCCRHHMLALKHPHHGSVVVKCLAKLSNKVCRTRSGGAQLSFLSRRSSYIADG